MNKSDPAHKKPLSPEQVYQKITAFCTFRDRSQKEVLEKLYAIGASKDIAKKAISKLLDEGYLNEDRMAKSYAGGKFRIKAWGRKKIEAHMKHLGLHEDLIKKGLAQIDEDDYEEKLKTLAQKKWASLSQEDPQKRIGKTVRYLASKGYESDKVWNMVNSLNK